MSDDTGLIIFSRLDSSRLPGKALMQLGSLPLLGHVLERTRLVKGEYRIILATSDREVDDPLVSYAEQQDIDVFRGSFHDVAGRALQCSKAFGLKRFARICGDRPFLDPELIDVLMAIHIKNKLDLATNVAIKTFPSGVATEVVSTEALEKIMKNPLDEEDREHVTRYFYQHQDKFKIFNLEATDERYADLNLSVDTEKDADRTRWMINHMKNPLQASLKEVVDLAIAWKKNIR